MNWEQVKGHWKPLKGTVKRKWRDFTDDEINIVGGRREELIGGLQAKYGYIYQGEGGARGRRVGQRPVILYRAVGLRQPVPRGLV